MCPRGFIQFSLLLPNPSASYPSLFLKIPLVGHSTCNFWLFILDPLPPPIVYPVYRMTTELYHFYIFLTKSIGSIRDLGISGSFKMVTHRPRALRPGKSSPFSFLYNDSIVASSSLSFVQIVFSLLKIKTCNSPRLSHLSPT
jgi:hypothetical protein